MSDFCSIDQAITIVGSQIAKQGFIALPARRENGCAIVPIGTRNKKLQVGSVTIFPHITAKTPTEAQTELQASVLDACRALVSEGGVKADAR